MHENVRRILSLKYVTNSNAQSRIKLDARQQVRKESSEYCIAARPLEME